MSKTIACPKCANVVPVDPGFEPWCEQCGWGCESRERLEKGVFDSIYAQIGQRLGERLFLELKNSEKAISKPKVTLAQMVAYLLAAPVLLATISLLATGLWFVVAHWFHPVPAFIGASLIGAAIALRPRFGAPPERFISRADAPELYRLVDDVARAMNTRTIDEIYVEPELNAAYGRHGIRRKSFLLIGAPLWLCLKGEEKLALIAHELAHQVNGDTARGYWIHTAIVSLGQWYIFLRQPYPDGADIAEIATHYLGLVLSVPVYLLTYALLHLNWNRSQRAEYLADYLGSRVSGTKAFVALNDRSSVLTDHWTNLFNDAKSFAHTPEKILPAFTSRFKSIPEREFERIRQMDQSELLTLDATHPPTHYRRLMLKSFPCPPQLTLSQDQSEKLNAEIAAFDGVMGKDLVNQYLPAM